MYILYVDDNVPRLHNIRTLIGRFESKLPEPVTTDQYVLFDELTMYYLNARYTEYKQKLSERLSEREVKNLLMRTKEAFAWLLTLKP